MYKRSLSRGSSIVAALSLVGILSIALLLTQVLMPTVSQTSQTAQVGDAMRSAPAPTVNGVTAACDTAKKSAAASGQTKTETSLDSTKNDYVDDCVGAVLDKSKPNPDPSDYKSYKCVGKTATVSVHDTKITDKSYADESQPEGKCKTIACSSIDNGKQTCFTAIRSGLTSADIKDSLAGYTPGTSVFETTPIKGLFSPSTGLPLDQSSASSVNDAFSSQQQQLDTQASVQQSKLDTAKNQLDQIARSCGEASEDATCRTQLAAAQEDVQKQEQAYKEAKARQDTFTSATQDLSARERTDPEVVDKTKNTGAGDCPGNPGCPGNPTGFVPKDTGKKDEAPADKGAEKGSGLGNIGSAIQSFLGGLLKGLGGAAAAPATGAACPSDPTAYAAQQQQYQQQMQQYQYQMQQYQYQQQQQQYQYQMTGYVPVSQLPPPTAPIACTPGSTSNTCAAAPPQPAGGCGAAGYVLKPVTTNQSNGAACTTGWQCVPDGSATTTPTVVPTAQLSCQPQVADVGMTVSLSFGCTDATRSSGTGFATLGATSGSTTTVLTAPPAGVNKATFGLTCINQNLKGEASCDVQVSKPSIVLLANPKVVATSTASTVGWVTSGMSSCVVSSPQQSDFTAANANNKSVNGMATTSPIIQSTDILLHCVTLGGGTRDATTTITIGGAGSGGTGGDATTSVSSTADGKNIARGEVNTITWSSVNPPSGSKMSLWLYDVKLGSVTGMIENDLVASSTYSWTLPKPGDACAEDLNQVCGTDLVPGRQYGIEADLYTGSLSSPTYGAQAFTPDVFTISQ